jgi:hypothetical protein
MKMAPAREVKCYKVKSSQNNFEELSVDSIVNYEKSSNNNYKNGVNEEYRAEEVAKKYSCLLTPKSGLNLRM